MNRWCEESRRKQENRENLANERRHRVSKRASTCCIMEVDVIRLVSR